MFLYRQVYFGEHLHILHLQLRSSQDVSSRLFIKLLSADDADIDGVTSATDLRCFSRLRQFLPYPPLLQFYGVDRIFFIWGVFYLILSFRLRSA